MKAAVLREIGAPLRLEDVELDEPKSGEVLVRIEAAGVCHSDLHYMTGDLQARLPLVVGHEGAGIVEAVGPGGRAAIAVGDRVALLWRPRCGECEGCVAGNPVLCRFGRVLATTNGLMDGTGRLHRGDERIHHLMGVSCFAERVVVSETSVLPVPDGVPPEIAAVSACAVITGVGAIWNVVHRPAGAPLAIMGVGGVGLAAVMGAALSGAHPVIAIDIDPVKLDLARRLGATHVVDARHGDVVDQVLELSGGGVPWAIDAVGRPETLRQSLGYLAARRHSGGDRAEQRRSDGSGTDQRSGATAETHRRLVVRLQQPAHRPAAHLRALPGRPAADRRTDRRPSAARGSQRGLR